MDKVVHEILRSFITSFRRGHSAGQNQPLPIMALDLGFVDNDLIRVVFIGT